VITGLSSGLGVILDQPTAGGSVSLNPLLHRLLRSSISLKELGRFRPFRTKNRQRMQRSGVGFGPQPAFFRVMFAFR